MATNTKQLTVHNNKLDNEQGWIHQDAQKGKCL